VARIWRAEVGGQKYDREAALTSGPSRATHCRPPGPTPPLNTTGNAVSTRGRCRRPRSFLVGEAIIVPSVVVAQDAERFKASSVTIC